MNIIFLLQGDAVIELLQEDDKAPKKLKRTALANLAAVQSQDALLNEIDGAIIGTPITASCGNCNCGSIGCGWCVRTEFACVLFWWKFN